MIPFTMGMNLMNQQQQQQQMQAIQAMQIMQIQAMQGGMLSCPPGGQVSMMVNDPNGSGGFVNGKNISQNITNSQQPSSQPNIISMPMPYGQGLIPMMQGFNPQMNEFNKDAKRN
eukprot:GHVR01030940.1.p2 GENE.GHVR01030940.1~~GHVR01030940.1.p2  ORF type:complete len:115 (-),score=16.15 GHVR01030940.1:1275-1619(-)